VEFLFEHFGLTAAGIAAAAREVIMAKGPLMALILAIDQGTTNARRCCSTVGCHRRQGVGAGRSELSQPGWVEQSPTDIWQSVLKGHRECVAASAGRTIAAVGIANQRESCLLWHRLTGQPIAPAHLAVPASAERIHALRTPAFEQEVQATTGLGLDPLFPAAKIGWLLDAYPEAPLLGRVG